MAAALGWGALAASSLVVGAFLTFARRWSPRQVGFVLAFGAGALISAVSFELAEEGFRLGGTGVTALGLGAGALTYYGLDGVIARRQATGRGRRGRAHGDDAGTALALGAFLDGIPEQAVLGINLAAGQGVGVALLVAIFVSNLPEAIGSADDMRKAARAARSCGSGSWSRRSAPWRRSPATRSPTPPAARARRRSTASPPAPCW